VAYWSEVRAAAGPVHLDPRLVLAVVKVESGFRPDAVSRAGAVGLMQVLPTTAAWVWRRGGLPGAFQVERLKDPDVNLRVGAYYLAYLLERAHGNVIVALSAYNGGPENAARWTESPWRGTLPYLGAVSFPETRAFVVKVLVSYAAYKVLLPFGG
jgi:soluble lytic murein transglycosylase